MLIPCLTALIAWFGGGIVSVVTGFGCGLFAMPIMMISIPTESAIAVTTVVSCVGMFLVLIKFWPYISWKRVIRLSLIAIPGAFAGVYILYVLSADYIKLVLGVFLSACVIWEILRGKYFQKKRKNLPVWLELIFGFFSGVVNGIAGIGGPVMGVYAALDNWDKDMARGTFGMFFGINIGLSVILQWSADLLGAYELELVYWSIPGIILGTFAGIPVATRISQTTFRRILLCCIGLSGATLIYKSLFVIF